MSRACGVSRVVATGETEFYPEVTDAFLVESARDADCLQILRQIGTRSTIIAPLKARGQVFGSICFVLAESGRRYTSAELSLAEELGHRAALAMENALLYRAAQEEIARRRDVQEEIQKLNAELETRVVARTQALQETHEQMEAFVYSISHDLRAPLRAMKGFSEALLEDFSSGLGEEGQDYARRVVHSAERMDRLIQDLLAYSRLSRTELQFSPIDLNALVADVVASFQQEIDARQATVEIAPWLPAVMGHRATLELVMHNLVSNALKFTSKERPPTIRIWAETRDRNLRIWLEDNGIGIEPAHHERIFRVFERLHPVSDYAGTGIGLAIVRRGVERMGGRSGVQSESGKGSSFWIEIPRCGGD
jgi:signal transduction histidine kinase